MIERIAAAHGKTAAQVSLRFLIQEGGIVIPRTSRPERLAENLAIFDFVLNEHEMEGIRALANPDGRIVDWSSAPAWDEPEQ